LTKIKETPWWYSLLWFTGLLLFKFLFGLKIEGKERIPRKGAMIITANHRSYLDPVVLALLVRRRMNFMAKEELFRHPGFGFLIRNLGAFPVKRERLNKLAFKKALQILKEGRILALFPEGTRSRSGKLGRLKEGPIRIAHHCRVPVVPVVIQGTEKVLPPGKKIPGWGKIKLRVGKPFLPVSSPEEREKAFKKALKQLKDEMISLGANE